MGDYLRVLPRDLFNEGNLLKCYGALVIALGDTQGHEARILQEAVDRFDVSQDESSGSLTISNITFEIGGVAHGLVRPLNSRRAWPLIVETREDDPEFEEVEVFEDDGALSADFLALIGA